MQNVRLLALASVLFLLSSCDRLIKQPKPAPPAPPPPTVTVAPPVEDEIMEWDEYNGHIEPVEQVEVRARISGTLESVHFTDGALVKKGDLLFTIDARPYAAAVKKARADLQRAEAGKALAAANLERARQLKEGRNISAGEYDIAAQATADVTASIAAANAQIDIAQIDVDYSRVLAPISGRISRRLVTPGNLVSGMQGTATLLTNIVTVSPVYCYLDADERSVLKYNKMAQTGGAKDAKIPCEMRLADEEGFPHVGTIDFIENRLDAASGTLRLRAVFENPDEKIKPGLFARARIPGSPKYKALLVPDDAVATDQGNKQVLVVNAKGQAEPRPVVVGPVTPKGRVIREGVTKEDRVIINGGARIVMPGMPVTAQTAEEKERAAKAAPAPAPAPAPAAPAEKGGKH